AEPRECARLDPLRAAALEFGDSEDTVGAARVVEGDDRAERGCLLTDLEDLGELSAGRYEDRAGTGIIEDVRDLVGWQRRVERNVGGTETENGEVGDGPLGPVLRE